MKIVINNDNLTIDECSQIFYKVRAVIENEKEEFIISSEGNKLIFPGGKRKDNESDIDAIKREIKEETGIDIDNFKEVLELETYYKDFYDYRTDSLKSRYTKTIYYYAKTNEDIKKDKMILTTGEIKEGFTSSFVNKEELIKMLSEDHKDAKNGIYFDEENKVVIDNILNNL